MNNSDQPSEQALPGVSVVMGVFNGADRLADTVSSVLCQTGCELEFVVVDDGSTDASGSLLAEFAKRDPRLRVIHQANAGLTRALITGCAAARGQFIARQDAGDVSLPGRMQQQQQALAQNPGLAFVSCATQFVEPGGAPLYRSAGTGLAVAARNVIDMSQRYAMDDGPSHHGSVMFRAEAYQRAGGYRPEFYFGQDWDLWFRLAQLGQFQMLAETLYRATIGVADISTRHKPLQEQIAALSLEALRLRIAGQSDQPVLQKAALIRPRPGHRSSRHSAASGSYFLGECLRRNGNSARARDYFRQALRLQPWHLKAWARLAQMAIHPGVQSVD